MNIITLDCLQINQKGKIVKVNSKDNIKRRLLDLGFIEGNIVTCLLYSPFNDPIAYKVLNTVIALRREDSKDIEVEVIYND